MHLYSKVSTLLERIIKVLIGPGLPSLNYIEHINGSKLSNCTYEKLKKYETTERESLLHFFATIVVLS